MAKKEKTLPRDYVPDFDELYEKTCEFVREKQGEKGFIDTQDLDGHCDTIYAFFFDEGEERGVEMEVIGVKEENDELFVKLIPVSSYTKIVFDDEDLKFFNLLASLNIVPAIDLKTDDSESGWFNIRYSNVYYASTLLRIAESIHEYVLD